MAQHDYVIANGTGAAVRSDLNNGLAAIVSNNSGATEPATMYAYQWWPDTTTGLLKIRNSANNAWVTVGTLASANLGLLSSGSTVTAALGSASTPGITFTGDTNTGIYSPGADQVAISTNGSGRLFIDASGNVGIGSSANNDYRLNVWQSGAGLQNALHLGSGSGLPNDGASLSFGLGAAFNPSSLLLAKIGAIFTGGTFQGALTFHTNGNVDAGNPPERMRIDNQGRVGIGSTSPQSLLHLETDGTALRIVRGSAIGFAYHTGTAATDSFRIQSNGGPVDLFSAAGQPITFSAGTTEKARIDSSGRLLVGTSSAIAGKQSQQRTVQIAKAQASTDQGLGVFHFDSGGQAPNFELALSKNNTLGSHTVVSSGDNCGSIKWSGSDGTGFVELASINGVCDGTPGTNDMPGRLVFATTADGASSPTERMRITSNGTFLFAKTADLDATPGVAMEPSGPLKSTRSAGNPFLINRTTNDGILTSFLQDGAEEGTISVSGTTVSYNGAHLSRWSQLPSGAEREEILRGSVLSNLDEMCEWGEEDNEQLNRMKVSDVEGDKNVSGVFQCWDDDDDTYTNDFYCAMTGDFIIRIAADVTVERGDLLMSAGDGTAKPQGDGYVQDKTIAKVTSTNVSCTYEDGSYCVPCVLMAC